MSDFILEFPLPFKTKNQKVALLQEIIRRKCAGLLRENGFVSYANEDLSWYRIVGDEVLHTVYFYSAHPRLPLILWFEFGCHPLFLEPEFPYPFTHQSKSYYACAETQEDIYKTFPLKPALEVNENRLTCSLPNEGEAVILEKYVLPLLDGVRTEEMAYRRHKELVIKRCYEFGESICVQNAWGATICFAEEAIYMGDEEMYPLCEALAIERKESGVYSAYDAKKLLHAEQILEYFKTGDRAKYIQLLEDRKQSNLNMLKKKLKL